MPHNKHVEDGFNIDIGMMQPDEAKNYYLDLAGDWEDPNPPPRIVMHESIRVVRDDDLVGSKVRGGDCLINSLPKNLDTIVYVIVYFRYTNVKIYFKHLLNLNNH